MGDHLIMSGKERNYKVILENILSGRMSLKEGAERMGVSYRHSKRLKKRYIAEGDAGLVHKSRGKRSGRALPDEFKNKVISLFKEKYSECGPTHASELLLEEDAIKVSPETLRLWLKESGLWMRHRKRSPYRQRRERRACFGELLQIDGSDHHWFGKNHPRCCLLNMVDDATGRTMALLDTGETTEILLTVLKKWISRYGVPQAVYVDLKSVYVSCGKETYSEFEKVCQRLSIKIIKAYSPQAKGRVERKHAVFQDRFVKELEIKGITEIDKANEYLEKIFLRKINRKFVVEPQSLVDGHGDAKLHGDLDQIICWEMVRQVKNDYTVQYKDQHYQLFNHQKLGLMPKKKITVRRHLNGKMSFWYDGKRLKYKSIKARPRPAQEAKPKKLGLSRSEIARRNKHKSPWARSSDNWLSKKKA